MQALGMLGNIAAELRAYVDMKARAAIARLVHFTYFSGSSASGTSDTVECDHEDPDAGTYLVRRMQHFGFRSRPPKGVAVIRLGNYEAAGNSVIVAEESDRYGPGDLEDGEVALYNKVTGTEIRIDVDGNIKIDAGPGKDVIVNGGTAKVARVGDQITASSPIVTWASQVDAALTTLSGASGAVVPVFSAPSPAFGAEAGTSNNLASITEGADNFKG